MKRGEDLWQWAFCGADGLFALLNGLFNRRVPYGPREVDEIARVCVYFQALQAKMVKYADRDQPPP